MPGSYHVFDVEIREWVLTNFPSRRTRILDVGAGSGKYRELLFDYPEMDALEMSPRYIERYKLQARYRGLVKSDVMANLGMFAQYDLVILGDVLEHLDVRDAQKVLAACAVHRSVALVSVPFEYEQKGSDQEPQEEHRQSDLTHERVAERYPGLRVVCKNPSYGVYVQGASPDEAQSPQLGRESMAVPVSALAGLSVVISTPIHSDTVMASYLESVWNTQERFGELGIPLGLRIRRGTGVQKVRNQLVADFLAVPGWTHLLFIDADHGWKPMDILRLLVMDREVIGIAARKKTHESTTWAANIEGEVAKVERGALQVSEVGAGFLLIRREALLRMEQAYPELKIKPSQDMHPEAAKHLYALFDFELDGEGNYQSEDLTFCRRWRAIGGDVWVDPDGDISHIGTYDYRGAIGSLIRGAADKEPDR